MAAESVQCSIGRGDSVVVLGAALDRGVAVEHRPGGRVMMWPHQCPRGTVFAVPARDLAAWPRPLDPALEAAPSRPDSPLRRRP